MHQKPRADGVVVDRETVRILLKILDADVVELRLSHHLARRTYASVGPNFDLTRLNHMNLQFMVP